jgi:hypothetical protein
METITMPFEKEKRQYPRAQVNWPLIIQTAHGEISGETINITVVGALIRCQEQLEADEAIDMVINVPALVRPLTIPAQVIHSSVCDPADENTHYEIGVLFVEISDKNKWLISTAVQRESGVMLMP